MVDLSVKLAKVHLPNPLINASGIYGSDIPDIIKTAEAKTGAVLYKTTTIEERNGNKVPRYWQDELFALNSIGLPNKGYKYLIQITPEVKQKTTKPMITSLLGFSFEEYITLCKAYNDSAVDIIEVNFSCPNIEGKPQAAYNFEYLPKLMKACREAAPDKPLFAKLPAYLDPSQRKMVAKMLIDSKFQGVTLINSLGESLLVNAKTEKTYIRPNNGLAGLTGKAIKPVALGNVWGFYNLLKDSGIQIMGVGGIECGLDVFEFILCGADAVQIGTAYIRQGTAVFEKMENELIQIMNEKGYTSLNDFRGKLKIWGD
ncbi:MAG: dihydroorotate oxidase [Candidatus Diapherotrites archaeon]|nr:dihydroorotate oxidase [Candidatus Diapherotrites archaeon]